MVDFPPVRVSTRQSPISLDRAEFHATVSARYFEIHWARTLYPTARSIAPTGTPHGTHFSVLAGFDDAGRIVLDGHVYLLRDLHFHAPSEHLVGTRQYAGELHMVHQSPRNGRHAVVAILLDAVDHDACEGEPKPELAKFLPRVLRHAERTRRRRAVEASTDLLGDDEREPKPLDPFGLLPEKRDFFRYQGSLTTAPFAESVSWIVFEQPILSTDPDLAALARRTDDDARAWQDADRRIVVHCSPEVGSDGPSGKEADPGTIARRSRSRV